MRRERNLGAAIGISGNSYGFLKFLQKPKEWILVVVEKGESILGVIEHDKSFEVSTVSSSWQWDLPQILIDSSCLCRRKRLGSFSISWNIDVYVINCSGTCSRCRQSAKPLNATKYGSSGSSHSRSVLPMEEGTYALSGSSSLSPGAQKYIQHFFEHLCLFNCIGTCSRSFSNVINPLDLHFDFDCSWIRLGF